MIKIINFYYLQVVTKVEATDLDAVNKNSERNNGATVTNGIKFSILKGNPQSNFIIDENTGKSK